MQADRDNAITSDYVYTTEHQDDAVQLRSLARPASLLIKTLRQLGRG